MEAYSLGTFGENISIFVKEKPSHSFKSLILYDNLFKSADSNPFLSL